MSKSMVLVKCLLILINLVWMSLSLAIFYFAYVYFDSDAELELIEQPLIAGWMSLGVAGGVFVSSSIGLFAVCIETGSKGFRFKLYQMLLMIMIGGEMATAVFLIQSKFDIDDNIYIHLERKISRYPDPENPGFSTLDWMQYKLECCGAVDYRDFLAKSHVRIIPESCCYHPYNRTLCEAEARQRPSCIWPMLELFQFLDYGLLLMVAGLFIQVLLALLSCILETGK